MIDKYNYSPGPTQVRENVRLARAKRVTNPDIDKDFVSFYKGVCNKYNKIINSSNDTYIIAGEAILGLEAACASLTEESDRVLVIDNGIYGHYFKDFVELYGGTIEILSLDYRRGIDPKEIDDSLRKDSDFKYATLVHCDTPTGVINDIDSICKILSKYNILSVVDSVSGMVGEKVNVDESHPDILIGGSQKAISAEPGLCFVTLSDKAKESIKNRKETIKSYYANLGMWEEYLKKSAFPYTLPGNAILSLEVALDNILDEGIEEVLKRHEKYANAVRKAVKEFGLELFLEDSYSNTVTAISLPDGIKATEITGYISEKYNIIIATSLDQFEDKILRIGHMGENARFTPLAYILDLLDESFKANGFKTDKNLKDLFVSNL